jgi:hypothetical protein
MIFAKAGFGAFLTAIFFAVTGPVFLMQDAGAGKPDDVAELLPRETLVFVEAVRAPRILKDWKEYVGAVCTQAGKKNVCDEIEKAVKPGIEMIPEKLLKDLEDGLPSLQRLAFAVLPPDGGEFAFAVIATSSDEAFFKKVHEDLKVFAGDEISHRDRTVLVIRKMGEFRFGSGLLVATVGNRMITTMHAPTMYAMLDRAAGKGTGEDLRANRLYKDLAPSDGDAPVIRGMADMPWEQMTAGRYRSGGYRAGRSGALELDEMDAIVDFRKIHGWTFDATLSPGKVASKARLHVDPTCRLYDVWKQPAGPKEALKFVPTDAILFVHANLKGGATVWPQIKDFIKRGDDIWGRRRGRESDTLKEMDREMSREIGITADEIAEAVGDEAAFAMVGEDPFQSERQAVESLLFVAKTTDADKAAALLDKVTEKIGNYEKKTEGDAKIWAYGREGEPMPHFAMVGKTAVMAMKPDVLKASLKSAADGGVFSKLLPEGAASSSKIGGVKHAAVWKLLQQIFRGDLPDFSKDLKLDGWSILTTVEEKSYAQVSSVDAGPAMIASASGLAFPIGILAFEVTRGPGATEVQRPKPEVKEPPVMALEKLAAEVKKNIEALKSEELTTRDNAMAAMRELGRQAATAVAEAMKKETDNDLKGRLLELLLEWKAYDVMPELAQRKADAFMQEFLKAAGPDPNTGMRFVDWSMEEGSNEFYGWYLEPYYVNLSVLQTLQHRDIVEVPAAMKRLGEGLVNEKVPAETRAVLAQLLAFIDASACGESVVAALAKETDNRTKAFLQIAVGWSSDPKAADAVIKGLKDGSRVMSRASFIAAERTKNAAVVEKLFELLKDADIETRWNAAYTLGVLSEHKVAINIFLPEAEAKVQIAAAGVWWENVKSTWKR